MAHPSQVRTLATIADAFQDARGVVGRVTAIRDQDHREELTVELELEIKPGAVVLDDCDDDATGEDGDEAAGEVLADLEDRVSALERNAPTRETLEGLKRDAGEESGVAALDELSDARRETLKVIAELGECPSSDIVDASQTDDAARKHAQWLKDHGLVKHRQDPDDGRRYLYSVSHAGAALLAGESDEENDAEEGDEEDDS